MMDAAHSVLRYPLIVASDLHLRDMEDERGSLLLDALRRIDGGPGRYFVLTGDVFDFCFGDSRYYRSKFAPLGRMLSELAAKGTRVIFVEGNHEFHMEHIGWDGVEIVTSRDYVIALPGGPRVQIMHGDLLKEDRRYQAFRSLVKSPLSRTLARLVPQRLLDWLCLRYASVSRGRDAYRTLNHEEVLAAAERWLGEGRFDHGIFGHFHVPYAEPRRSGGLILSVDSWDRPNLLVYGEGGFARVWLEGVRQPWRIEPARPFLKRGDS